MFVASLEIPLFHPDTRELLEEEKIQNMVSFLQMKYANLRKAKIVIIKKRELHIRIDCEGYAEAISWLHFFKNDVLRIERMIGIPTTVGYHILQSLNGLDV